MNEIIKDHIHQMVKKLYVLLQNNNFSKEIELYSLEVQNFVQKCKIRSNDAEFFLLSIHDIATKFVDIHLSQEEQRAMSLAEFDQYCWLKPNELLSRIEHYFYARGLRTRLLREYKRSPRPKEHDKCVYGSLHWYLSVVHRDTDELWILVKRDCGDLTLRLCIRNRKYGREYICSIVCALLGLNPQTTTVVLIGAEAPFCCPLVLHARHNYLGEILSWIQSWFGKEAPRDLLEKNVEEDINDCETCPKCMNLRVFMAHHSYSNKYLQKYVCGEPACQFEFLSARIA